jgi:hypothetical protein
MDCTTTGAPPPTGTPPTSICRPLATAVLSPPLGKRFVPSAALGGSVRARR